MMTGWPGSQNRSDDIQTMVTTAHIYLYQVLKDTTQCTYKEEEVMLPVKPHGDWMVLFTEVQRCYTAHRKGRGSSYRSWVESPW